MKPILLLTILLGVSCGHKRTGDKGSPGNKTVVHEIDGRKGDKGDRGDTGINGESGVDGQTGNTGPAGRKGADGAEGPRGLDGRDGIDGQDGRDAGIARHIVCTFEYYTCDLCKYKLIYQVRTETNGDVKATLCGGLNADTGRCLRGDFSQNTLRLGNNKYQYAPVRNRLHYARLTGEMSADVSGNAMRCTEWR